MDRTENSTNKYKLPTAVRLKVTKLLIHTQYITVMKDSFLVLCSDWSESGDSFGITFKL